MKSFKFFASLMVAFGMVALTPAHAQEKAPIDINQLSQVLEKRMQIHQTDVETPTVNGQNMNPVNMADLVKTMTTSIHEQQNSGVAKEKPLSEIKIVRQYSGKSMPAHIKEKVKFDYDPNFTPYYKIVNTANGKTVKIVVRDTPVYVIYTTTDGKTHDEILYPNNELRSTPPAVLPLRQP